ncbi:MAG: tRNA glutamyl-Q(34) synthetase GluQRS [Hyphomicrobiaceae bacterium]
MTGAPPAAKPGQPVLRFAPSPTGRLHLGHALSALVNVELVRRLGGRFLIRIEDTDLTRCRPDYAQAMLEDLEWLGVRSDGPILRQSEHLAVYAAAADRLAGMGLLYPCFATRQEIQAAAVPGQVDPDGAPIYPGLYRGLAADEAARRMAAGEAYALRLDMGRAVALALGATGGAPITYTEIETDGDAPRRVMADPMRWGDVVIVRKETAASYHLAVVVDDARQDISHVVRGADLRAATDIHRLLQVLLGLPEPHYRHHRLIVDADGRKLANRAGDTSLAELRGRGASPADIRRMVGLEMEMQC